MKIQVAGVMMTAP